MNSDARAAAIVLALATMTRVAAAQPGSPEHDAAFRNGLEQYNRGNNVGAITTWESLLGTLGEERGFKVLYNLGLAYQAIGDVTHAIERYRAFVKQVSARTDVSRDLAERAADAQAKLEQLERTHGSVTVRAPKRGGLVLTRVGTSEPRAAGFVVWLAPGRHEIELFVGTDHVKKVTVDVVQGKAVDIDTSPPEEPSAPAAPSPASTPPSAASSARAAPSTEERSNRWIWIGAAATAVSFALPIATYVVATRQKDDATALGRGNSEYADARDSFERWKTVHYVSYALPAVFALATVVYVVFRPSATTKLAVAPTGAAFHATF